MGNPAPHRARKRFGQHFLHDRNIIQKIISSLNPKSGDTIVEIGPGQGALTFPLLKQCGELTAIELDRDLIPILQGRSAEFGCLHLINQDILKTDIAALGLKEPLRLVGNLPYNISTPLMFHLLQSPAKISDMIFMLQKEVALRICASEGNKQYGRLSVMMQFYCQVEYLFDVPPACFSPPPKVDSAVIRLKPYKESPYTPVAADALDRLVSLAFNQRRKTLGNSLKTMIDRDSIAGLGIDPTARAENLTLDDFINLTRSLETESE